MARSRKNAWLRDELILALDLYRRAGRKPSLSQLDDLSATLRDIPIEQELALDPKFRGRDSVYLKLANFVSLDPNADITGMTGCGAEDRRVWDEFADDPLRLERVASAIRRTLAMSPPGVGLDDDAEDGAPEGRILARVHLSRERNRGLETFGEGITRAGNEEVEVAMAALAATALLDDEDHHSRKCNFASGRHRCVDRLGQIGLGNRFGCPL